MGRQIFFEMTGFFDRAEKRQARLRDEIYDRLRENAEASAAEAGFAGLGALPGDFRELVERGLADKTAEMATEIEADPAGGRRRPGAPGTDRTWLLFVYFLHELVCQQMPRASKSAQYRRTAATIGDAFTASAVRYQVGRAKTLICDFLWQHMDADGEPVLSAGEGWRTPELVLATLSFQRELAQKAFAEADVGENSPEIAVFTFNDLSDHWPRPV